MSRAITPDEAKQHRQPLPDFVFEVFNELIKKNFRSGSATVKQDEAVREIVKKGGVSRQSIFDNHWLDVEDYYRDNGWNVEFDKPGYNETYDAFFVFRVK